MTQAHFQGFVVAHRVSPASYHVSGASSAGVSGLLKVPFEGGWATEVSFVPFGNNVLFPCGTSGPFK